MVAIGNYLKLPLVCPVNHLELKESSFKTQQALKKQLEAQYHIVLFHQVEEGRGMGSLKPEPAPQIRGMASLEHCQKDII